MENESNIVSLKVKNLFRNFALMILCYLIFFIILRFLDVYFPAIDLTKYQQSELFEKLEANPVKFILLATILAPVIEESIFRSLLNPSPSSIKVFICAILYFFVAIFIPEEGNWFLNISLLFLSFFLVYYALTEMVEFTFFEKIANYLQRYPSFIWITGAILFGFVHIFNYVDFFYVDMTLFLLIFPRIIAGFFFGKVKIENNGLIWPIILHSMNNSLVVILLLPSILSQ